MGTRVSPRNLLSLYPSAPALSTLSHASNLDWRSISHMIIHMIQCCSLKSSHPCLFPQSSKVCPLYLCLFCCLACRVIVIQYHDIPTQHNTTTLQNCCMEHSQSTWNAHEVRPHTSLKTSLNFFSKTEILKNMFSGSRRI